MVHTKIGQERIAFKRSEHSKAKAEFSKTMQ